ncbi:MAG: class II aldolase/adducin family protein, partial [Chloroflexota bacterium]|nr:class II aldolase/adducin family protein [Chloroflexota bacterium]
MIFESRWDDAYAVSLDQLGLLVHRSNLLGQDERIVNRGGGNTSTKRLARDFRGREVRVLNIKQSGGDLKTATRENFPEVRLDDLLEAQSLTEMPDEDMVDYLAHALLEPAAPRPSIETLLHGFLPWQEVDHVHADAILAFCMAERGEEISRQVFGREVIWVPYIRPGFSMAKWCVEAVERQPDCRAVFLGKHGLVTWADSAKQSYLNTLEFINRAAEYIEHRARGKQLFGGLDRPVPPAERRLEAAQLLLPALRGRLSRGQRVILHYTAEPEVLKFVNSRDSAPVAARGLACPDHVLYTKVKPLFLRLEQALGSPESRALSPVLSAECRVPSAEAGPEPQVPRAEAAAEGQAAEPRSPDTGALERALDTALAAYEADYRRFFEQQSGVS